MLFFIHKSSIQFRRSNIKTNLCFKFEINENEDLLYKFETPTYRCLKY